MTDFSRYSWWTRFWHEPVRAERLAATRILLAVAILTDQLVQFLPFLPYFYGPEGVAPEGTHDAWLLSRWRWSILLFNTDDLTIVYGLFWLRFAVAALFLVGWHTRLMNLLLWLLTYAFVFRNPLLRNGADDTLLTALFLLMFMPSGAAFSIDSWWKRRRTAVPDAPPTIPAWPVRLLQIQLCIIYLTTGLAKLREWPTTWWEGTSLHYVLNDITMTRWSYAQLPLPLWMTAIGTWLSVGWEVLFTPLVLFRRTRKWALWFGVVFHIAIWLTIEVGWFSFYTLSLYGVWIPDRFWQRWTRSHNPTRYDDSEDSIRLVAVGTRSSA